MQQKVKNSVIPVPPKLLSPGDAYGHLVEMAENLRLRIATAKLPNGLPRYDILSKIASRVPFFVYDNPDFTKYVGCDTAFTDGTHVFFHADFLSRCLLDDVKARKEGSPVTSSIFLGLHELSHISNGHTSGRMSDCPPAVRAIATDVKINLTLKYLYKHIPGDTLSCGAGLTDEEKNIWLNCSEELIAFQLMALQKKWREEQKNKSSETQQSRNGSGQNDDPDHNGDLGQGKDPGRDGAPNQGGASGQDDKPTQDSDPGQVGLPSKGGAPGQNSQPPVEGQGGGLSQGSPQASSGSSSKNKSPSGLPQLSSDLEERLKNSLMQPDEHVVDLKTLIKALEDAGLEHVKAALKLPDANEDAKIKMVEDNSLAQLGEDLQALAKERNEIASNSGFGGPSESFTKEYLQKRNRSHKSYKSSLRDLYLGDGSVDVMPCDDVPAPVFYINHGEINFAEPLYLDSLIPAKKEHGVLINIVDSSGSMGKLEIGQALSELHQQLQQAEDENGVSKVYFWSADTQLRGAPIEVTKDNVEKLCEEMPIFGRGGTDITVPIKQAIEWSHENKVRVDGILYISDLDVNPPARSELPQALPPIVILGAGSNPNFLQQQLVKWKSGCKGFAEVSLVGVEEDIDFTQLAKELGCDEYHEKTNDYGNLTPNMSM